MPARAARAIRSWRAKKFSTPSSRDNAPRSSRPSARAVAAGLAGDLRQLADGMVDAGGALVGLHVDGLGLRVLAQRLLDRRRLDRVAPLALERDRVDPVGLGELRPALAELAAVDHHRGVA